MQNRTKKLLTGITALLVLGIVWTGLPTQKAVAEDPPAPEGPYPYEITVTDHVLGEPDAPVTIIEYASLSCNHCADFHNTVFPALKEQYINTGKVRFIFRDFPFNAPALRGAMLAHCAGSQRYYTFLKVLFRTQDKWAFNKEFMKNLQTVAELGGMGGDAFTKCMADTDLETRIITTKKEGFENFEVKATPTFLINGKKITGSRSIEELATIIDPLVSTTNKASE